jgi:transposase, IS30 family
MDYPNNNTKSRKNKHLSYEERMKIQLRLQDGYTRYKIAKELGRSLNTITNEIKRGTTTQIVQGKKIEVYLADKGKTTYLKNRQNSCRTYKRLECNEFINYVVDKVKNESWSPDACVGHALETARFKRSEMVCTKTLYNYIDLNLLPIRNTDLPLKLLRNTKPKRVRQNRKNLGKSIEERPEEINSREEFGHWGIDTVIGEKTNQDKVLLTLVERQTRNTLVRQIESKTADSVIKELTKIRILFGDQFSQVFKSITGDNGSEFANLSTIEKDTQTQVYFTHPFSSWEKGTNERHNGLLRRFIPKGKRIDHFDITAIAFIEDWVNTLPRKILGYKTPEELFEEQLDKIYAA